LKGLIAMSEIVSRGEVNRMTEEALKKMRTTLNSFTKMGDVYFPEHNEFRNAYGETKNRLIVDIRITVVPLNEKDPDDADEVPLPPPPPGDDEWGDYLGERDGRGV
jgi:hypothetical protein